MLGGKLFIQLDVAYRIVEAGSLNLFLITTSVLHALDITLII
jgi:hypothetical protein